MGWGEKPRLFFLHFIQHTYLVECVIKSSSGNIYRAFFIFDDDRIVMLFNGFQKKTQKTPQSEIEKAIKLKNEYYASK